MYLHNIYNQYNTWLHGVNGNEKEMREKRKRSNKNKHHAVEVHHRKYQSAYCCLRLLFVVLAEFYKHKKKPVLAQAEAFNVFAQIYQ